MSQSGQHFSEKTLLFGEDREEGCRVAKGISRESAFWAEGRDGIKVLAQACPWSNGAMAGRTGSEGESKKR